AHRALLDVLQAPGRAADLAGAQVAEDEALLAVLVCGDAHHLDAGARARHADQVEPGLGELLARDVRVLLVPDALLVLHRQVEARLPALVAPDAPQAAAAAPAVAALAPRAVGRLLGRLLLREHRLILAEGARL